MTVFGLLPGSVCPPCWLPWSLRPLPWSTAVLLGRVLLLWLSGPRLLLGCLGLWLRVWWWGWQSPLRWCCLGRWVVCEGVPPSVHVCWYCVHQWLLHCPHPRGCPRLLARWGTGVIVLILMPWVRGWVIGRRIISPGILRRAAWLHPSRVLLRLSLLGWLRCGLRRVLRRAVAVAALRGLAREWLQWRVVGIPLV